MSVEGKTLDDDVPVDDGGDCKYRWTEKAIDRREAALAIGMFIKNWSGF